MVWKMAKIENLDEYVSRQLKILSVTVGDEERNFVYAKIAKVFLSAWLLDKEEAYGD